MTEKDIERIIFVPVIHTDTESIERVREIVRNERPEVVAVELDRERYEQVRDGGRVDLTEFVSSGDPIENLMQQIASLELALGNQMGSGVGAEMLAAIEEGRRIGAKIALVDRPIRETMRALMKVPLDEIYRLMNLIPETAQEVASGEAKEYVDSLKTEEGVAEMMAQFRSEFPAITDALIDQRDEYVARALESILGDVKGKIVAVLGAGHIEGVRDHLLARLRSESQR